MGVTHAWRCRSMVFALVTRELLARPRPCGLHTPPAFNTGVHATYPWCEQVCMLSIFNVRALCQRKEKAKYSLVVR
jgi:hypothetical protein